MLRIPATLLSILLLVGVTDAAGAVAAPTQAGTLSAPSLRVVPDTRSELRDLPRSAPLSEHTATPAETPVEDAPVAATEAPAPEAPAAVAPLAAWPVDRGLPITDVFGPRHAPTAGASTNHRGIDFGAPAGTPVVAAAAGTVTQVVTTDSGACGVEVIVQHDASVGSVSTRYCHLLVGSPAVEVGSVVTVGQQLAAVGSTGVSTGAHLHFEVLLPGGEAIDPLPWLEHHSIPVG